MTSTVSRWTTEELERVRLGKDKKLATLLLNKKTYSEAEIPVYHIARRTARAYTAFIQDLEEPYGFLAPDDEHAIWFLQQEFKPEAVLQELSWSEHIVHMVEIKDDAPVCEQEGPAE